MKKFSKLFATLGAVAMLGLGVFTSCGGDDGGSDPVLDKIEIKTNPTKTQYTVGDEALDPAGLVITEKWTEGKKDVEVAYDENKDKFAFSGFDSSAAVETQAITVTYQKKTATFNISVVEAGAEDPKITAIAVKEGSTATYAIDEALAVTITATYSDGDAKDLTLEEFKALEGASVTGFDSSAAAVDQEVTFKLGESISTTFKVTIKDITVTGVEVDSTTHKTEYYIGDELDVTGLTVKVTYSEGEPKAGVAVTSDMVTGFDSSAAATDQELTITYKAGITTKYKVNVIANPVKTIAITTKPTKVEYDEGDTLDTTGLVVTATLTSGKTRVLTAEEYTVAPTTLSTAGDEISITVTSTETATATAAFTVKVLPLFSKFDAAELRTQLGNTSTSDLDIASTTDDAKEVSASDDTWKLVVSKGKKKAQVKYNASGFVTYDYNESAGTGYKWTNRLSYNKQESGIVSLKLKVGAGTSVVLRVDGGSIKDAPNSGATNLTFTGAGTAVTWNPVVSLSTKYVTVTGDADGYVTITSTDKANGANIYGITVVAADEVVDTSAVVRKDGNGDDVVVGTAAAYNVPTITGLASSVTQGQAVSATVSNVETLVKSKSSTQKVYADGHLGDATEGKETVDADTAIKWYATGSAENAAAAEIGTGPSLSWTTSADTAADTYAITVSYTVDEKTYTSEAGSVQVLDSSKTYVTITFDKGSGTLADGAAAPTQSVESGAATALTAFASLGITAPTGKAFDGWAESESGEKKYDDGAEVTLSAATTLYAVYKAASVYTLLASTYASGLPTELKVSDQFTIGSAIQLDKTKQDGKNECPNFKTGGAVTSSGKNIEVTVSESSATIKITWFCTSDSRTSSVSAKTGTTGTGTATSVTKQSDVQTKTMYTDTWTIAGKGTYLVGGTNGINITEITLTE